VAYLSFQPEGDPNNYMTFFRRATVYLAMGKSKSALPDLDRVIELKPDFTAVSTQYAYGHIMDIDLFLSQARLRRGNVKMKQGALDDALADYKAVLEKEATNEEALGYVNDITPLKEAVSEARRLVAEKDYNNAIEILGGIIEVCVCNIQFIYLPLAVVWP
jgi:DnaJ family protein C protein 3